MLTIFICEDDPKQLSTIKEYIHRALIMQDFEIREGSATTDPRVLLQEIKQSAQVGLYFLDINFNTDINGLRLATEIRKYDPRGFIVFITTHSELSYLTFEYGVEALDYIVKDVPDAMFSRISSCIKRAYQRYMDYNSLQSHSIILEQDGRQVILEQDEIIYICSSQTVHKIDVHTKDSIISIYASIKKLLNQLPQDIFYRCHKSYIISLRHIYQLNSKNRTVTMKNGDICEVSARKLKELILLVHSKQAAKTE